MPARTGNPKHLSSYEKGLVLLEHISARGKKYTWSFSNRTNSVPALQTTWWVLQCGGMGKGCVYGWQREKGSERNGLSGLLKHLHFRVQDQEPFIALHLQSSRKSLPQARLLCQFGDRYSILGWFWMWSQYWPNHGNWVTALNLERQLVLLNAFKHFQPFGWKMLMPVLPLVTWSKTVCSKGPAKPY